MIDYISLRIYKSTYNRFRKASKKSRISITSLMDDASKIIAKTHGV